MTICRAIEDAAIFDEDEDDKDDNSEDDSISEIRRDAGGKTKKSVPCKKTNSSSIMELNNEDNSDHDASPKAKVGGRHVKSKKSGGRKKLASCGGEENENDCPDDYNPSKLGAQWLILGTF